MKIAPSILSADFAALGEAVARKCLVSILCVLVGWGMTMPGARAAERSWPGPLVVVRFGEVVPNAGYPARTETEWFSFALFKPDGGLCRVELRRA